MKKLTVGELFAGIGGIGLGLERTGGFEVRWQVEKDEYCRRVLAKHWPDVTRYEDVRHVGGEQLEAVDLICGGFPCQDISVAGKGEGIEGSRSGLWREMWRVVRELRPRYALVENVGALAFRGLGRILGDLAGLGMDAWWGSIRASQVGAPHARDRLFIVANTYGFGCRDAPFGRVALRQLERRPTDAFRVPKLPESPICRVDDGVPHRVDRLRALGNAVVPQVAEWIGARILEAERALSEKGAA